MKWGVLMTVALAGAGCATTTSSSTAPAASPAGPPPPWFAGGAPPDAQVEPVDPAPDQPDVVVVATSPTNVQFRPAGTKDVVVPPRHARPPLAALRRRSRVYTGMVIGASIGFIAGLAGGVARENAASGGSAECDPFCGSNPVLGGVAFGAIGLGLGAAVAAISNHFIADP